MNKVKVAFLGNSEISLYALKSLFKSDFFDIKIIISGNDKPIGRSRTKMVANPVVEFAKENNLNLFQTDNINNDFENIKDVEVDYIITCSFGQFLADKVLSWPLKKSINIHTSLLPKGRGGAPIHWAIILGEKKSGYSIMEMESKMDSGSIYFQRIIDIEEEDTYKTLYQKLSNLILDNFEEDFLNSVLKNPKPLKQDEDKVTFWMNIKKEDRYLDFSNSALEVHNKIKGLFDKPISLTIYNDLEIKITKSSIDIEPFPMVKRLFMPGQIVATNNQGIIVQTGKGLIAIEEFILPGKKNVSFKQFKNGNKDFFKLYSAFKTLNKNKEI